MKKFAFTLHSILGMLLGLLVSLLCLTGAMMVFEDELRELTSPELYFSTPPTDWANRKDIDALAQDLTLRTLEEEGQDVVVAITIAREEGRNHVVNLERSDEMLYIDPYTGDIKGQRTRRDGFFGWVMRLHRWLLDGSKSWGKAIVGYGTLGFVIILLSGLILWLPKSRKALGISLRVKTSASRRRLLLDLHRSVGAYALLPLLVLATTGLNWSFPWWRSGLYGICGTEYPKKAEAKGQDTALPSINYGQWHRVFEELQARYPNYKTIRISDGKAEVRDGFVFGNPRAVDKLNFDPETGQITKTTPYADESRGQKVRGWIYALHTGAWGGWLSKILTFIVALVGASLPWTGLYLARQKKSEVKKAKTKQG